MLNNVVGVLDLLDKLREEEPEKITLTYQKLFNMPEGELILADLMDHFFEFRPTSTDHEAGSQAVIIYIKNRILGVTEQKQSALPIGDQS